ncbi:MAG: TIGR00266 family protein [Thermoprotei archaeon]|nr:MAG: TIGR00266 family protein [Thermoprotei archaeon]
MKYEIKYRPSYSMLVVYLDQDESIMAEAGAMSYMTPNIEIRTRMRQRSIWSALKLSVIGAQSFFVNEYIARNGPGEIGLVAAPIGDVTVLKVSPGRGYIIQKASYIASTPNISLDIKWQGFTKGLFGQGLFMIKAEGEGDLFINTFGAIDRHDLLPGEKLIVDNFHLVAFSSSCNYVVRRIGGLKELFLSGEGLVVEITGPGEVYLQTKNLSEFVNWLWTLLEPMVESKAR